MSQVVRIGVAPSGATLPARSRPAPPAMDVEKLSATMRELESRDPQRIQTALAMFGKLDPAIADRLVRMLPVPALSELAARALKGALPRIAGQLADVLLDESEDLELRRRIPRILAETGDRRVLDALQRGLEDERFDIRFQCGLALARLLELHPNAEVDRRRVVEAALAASAADRSLWEARTKAETGAAIEPFADTVLRERADKSVRHVFTLLSLLYPKEPLELALHGLRTEDAMLRGTSLEYLESILPPELQRALIPALESGGRGPKHAPARSREQILEELMRSRESIQISLEELRKASTSDG
jgi:HEAT repeat protein